MSEILKKPIVYSLKLPLKEHSYKIVLSEKQNEKYWFYKKHIPSIIPHKNLIITFFNQITYECSDYVRYSFNYILYNIIMYNNLSLDNFTKFLIKCVDENTIIFMYFPDINEVLFLPHLPNFTFNILFTTYDYRPVLKLTVQNGPLNKCKSLSSYHTN